MKKNGGGGGGEGCESYVVCDLLKFASLVFLDIGQDCSLGHCLTASRAETQNKFCVGLNRSKSGPKRGLPVFSFLPY